MRLLDVLKRLLGQPRAAETSREDESAAMTATTGATATHHHDSGDHHVQHGQGSDSGHAGASGDGGGT